jgi:hypothetical protein
VYVSSPDLVALPARSPFDREYTSFREDVARDLVYLGRNGPGGPVD